MSTVASSASIALVMPQLAARGAPLSARLRSGVAQRCCLMLRATAESINQLFRGKMRGRNMLMPQRGLNPGSSAFQACTLPLSHGSMMMLASCSAIGLMLQVRLHLCVLIDCLVVQLPMALQSASSRHSKWRDNAGQKYGDAAARFEPQTSRSEVAHLSTGPRMQDDKVPQMHHFEISNGATNALHCASPNGATKRVGVALQSGLVLRYRADLEPCYNAV